MKIGDALTAGAMPTSPASSTEGAYKGFHVS
jgi:hypothetical protein